MFVRERLFCRSCHSSDCCNGSDSCDGSHSSGSCEGSDRSDGHFYFFIFFKEFFQLQNPNCCNLTHCDKNTNIQIETKLECSNCDKTQTQIVTTIIQIVTTQKL